MSNAVTPEVKAVYHPGHFYDQENWSCSYYGYTVNGLDAGFHSDAIFVLVDDYGVDFDRATKLVSKASAAADDFFTTDTDRNSK